MRNKVLGYMGALAVTLTGCAPLAEVPTSRSGSADGEPGAMAGVLATDPELQDGGVSPGADRGDDAPAKDQGSAPAQRARPADGSGAADTGGAAGPGAVFSGPTKGAGVVLRQDGELGVVVNRDLGSVTVVEVSYEDVAAEPSLAAGTEVVLGPGSEPWQVALSPDGEQAFVILRQAQELVAIADLDGAPKLRGRVTVGSEPTGLALSPTGARAYVANWSDGTVSVVDTGSLQLLRTIDLNPALVATGYLGEVAPRPALSHPRSIAITNDGDSEDDDETLYVTEYFGQQVVAEDAIGSRADRLKVGLVYAVSLEEDTVQTIPLQPLADMGFADNNGAVAGCFPNQLQDIALHDHYAYVVSVCASPRGPISFKTNTAPLLSIIDLEQGAEIAAGGQSFNRLFVDLYEAAAVPDDASRRLPLLANDISFVPGTNVGYVTAGGADAVFRFEVSENDGRIDAVGASTNLFINLLPAGLSPALFGQRPIGMAIAPGHKTTALVANDVSRNATLIDFNTQAIAGGVHNAQVVATGQVPAPGSREDAERRGKRFFTTGLVRWSLAGQAWGACESCHGDGLSDNVTWYFPTGPRQSVAMDGTFASNDPTDQRILNWTAVRDEIHDFELNTRNVSGGVGAGVDTLSDPPQESDRIDLAAVGAANLGGSAAAAMDPQNPLGFAEPPLLNDWNEITAWVQTIRTPRRPSQLDPELVAAGRALFIEGGCRGCHSGPKWTISRRFYSPSADTNTALLTTLFEVPAGFPTALLPALDEDKRFIRFQDADLALDQIQCTNREVGTFGVAEAEVGQAELRQDMSTKAQGQGDGRNGRGYNIPSLLGVSAGAPYFHAGGARTLEASLTAPFEAHTRALSPNLLTETDPAERGEKVAALVSYLLAIDEESSAFQPPAAGAQGGDLCVRAAELAVTY